jgi:hypothetical protein
MKTVQHAETRQMVLPGDVVVTHNGAYMRYVGLGRESRIGLPSSHKLRVEPVDVDYDAATSFTREVNASVFGLEVIDD